MHTVKTLSTASVCCLEVSISHKEAMGQLLSSEKGGLMRADVMDMEKGLLLVHVS